MVRFDFNHSKKKRKKHSKLTLCTHKIPWRYCYFEAAIVFFLKVDGQKLLFFSAKKVLYTEFQDSFSKATTRAR